MFLHLNIFISLINRYTHLKKNMYIHFCKEVKIHDYSFEKNYLHIFLNLPIHYLKVKKGFN